jgi:hypothetical protein
MADIEELIHCSAEIFFWFVVTLFATYFDFQFCIIFAVKRQTLINATAGA